MNNQEKAIANYNLLVSKMSRRKHIRRWTKNSLPRYARNHNVRFIRTWTDATINLGRINNHYFSQMLDFCAKHQYVKYAVFDFAERFACSTLDYNERMEAFQKLGVKVEFLLDKMPDFHDYAMDILKKILEDENA